MSRAQIERTLGSPTRAKTDQTWTYEYDPKIRFNPMQFSEFLELDFDANGVVQNVRTYD
jgi:hypothetical protein